MKEKPIDGFTSEVEKTSDEGDEIDFTMKNTWVGPDYVNVKGQVFWTGDEGKEDLRPDSVKITVVNSDGDRVRTIEVEADGDGKFSVPYLPEKRPYLRSAVGKEVRSDTDSNTNSDTNTDSETG